VVWKGILYDKRQKFVEWNSMGVTLASKLSDQKFFNKSNI